MAEERRGEGKATDGSTDFRGTLGPDTIGFQLAKAAVAARRVFTSQVARVYDVAPTEVAILDSLLNRPGISSSVLVASLGIAAPGISVHLDSMRKRGLVERRQIAKDKRERALFLTAKGAALAKAVRQRLDEAECDAFGFSPSERILLLSLLSKINASSMARAGADPATWDDVH